MKIKSIVVPDLDDGTIYDFATKIEKVKAILLELVENQPSCFDEPRPLFMLKEIGEWFILGQFSFWVQKEYYLEYNF